MRARRTGTGHRVTRLVAVPWALWGTAMLVRPGDVTRLAGGPEPAHWVVRLLGARLVAQHVTALVHPTRAVVLAGAGVDLLHASSMVLARVRWPAHARPVWVSGSTSVASAVLGLLTAPAARR
ncbi:hypothetical protein GCU67_15215 [Modestobacter muralis]|uniref:DUF4267 domain-containing protein n=1 Tax=Modestobacter muralis TaxID=1608614 RepID=A0A6P0H9J5_9ACTN|nr:hypothetical protein [Modestobacter muralis]NEK95504.1 hypothetical protein [Modestobacter muralis]NEN52392.1 hypothetical protein [Modestobacter muralis]